MEAPMRRGLAVLAVGLLVHPTGITFGQGQQALVDTDGVQRVSITGGSYFFRPAHIILKVNVPAELSVRMERGVVPHNFVVNAPAAGMVAERSLDIAARTIRFTPAKIGRYPFYCDNRFLFFRSHRERGMEGVIEVVE
jgi:plastocyanin domain-containing protein